MSPRRSLGSAALALAPLLGCSSTSLDVVNLHRDDASVFDVTDAGSQELAPPPRSDLVAHWSFDEGAGTIAHDDSGNGYHGHLVGGTWVTGHFGGALAIMPGDYVAVNGFEDATPGWTVSLWLRLTLREVHGNWGALVSTEINASGGWMVYLEGDAAPMVALPRLNFELSRPGSTVGPIGCCLGIQADTWYHVTVVADADVGKVFFYEGSTLMSTASLASKLSPGDPTLYMGKWRASDSSSAGFLSGTLDDVSIFSRALTVKDVSALDMGPPQP
jgi:hypothetical protein